MLSSLIGYVVQVWIAEEGSVGNRQVRGELRPHDEVFGEVHDSGQGSKDHSCSQMRGVAARETGQRSEECLSELSG